MPTVEIVQFPGSDEFVADNLVFKDCLSKLLKSEGCISVYYGIQTEDNRTAYLLVSTSFSRRIRVEKVTGSFVAVWETYDHHMKFTKHESYPAAMISLQRAQAGPLDVQHVDFDEDAALAMGAPVTEVVTLVPHSGLHEEALGLKAKLKEAMVADGSCHCMAVGESREKKGTLIFLLGWDSVEVHYDVVSKGAFPEIIRNLYRVSNLELKHVKLTKYTE